jgi:hypothetical protein
MRIYLTPRWNGDIPDPTDDQLLAALAELDIPDDEHPDACVWDENEWAISAFGSGRVVFGNMESADEYEMTGVSRAKMLDLWKALQRGDLDAIWREPWRRR